MNPTSVPGEGSPPPQAKPVTIQDIATALGVHKSSVSLAFSGKPGISAKLRERILSLAEELGYAPDPLAQRLANRSASRVVCLCSGSLDPGRGTEKIAAIQSELTGLGLEVPFYTPAKSATGSPETQINLFRQMRRMRPQAIVCSVHAFQDAALEELRNYQQEGGIVITYDLPVSLPCDQIIFDRTDNVYQAARYLLERGHRKLGIGMSQRTASHAANFNSTQQQRIAGLQRALADWNLPLRPEWIFENEVYEAGGAAMARHYLELKDRPTGLCIVNDHVALAFMVETQRAGLRIPEELSLVGQDDQPIAAYCPVPLTSISQPAQEVVHAVVERLRLRLEGDTSPPQTITIRGRLVERQSVAPPPQ